MTEPGERKARGGGPRGFTTIGDVSDPAFVRLPDPKTVFATRSARLAAVAEGNPLEPFLRYLAGLAAVQHAAPLFAEVQVVAAPLSKQTLTGDDSFAMLLEWTVLHAAMGGDAPAAAEAARARLQGYGWSERLALADAVYDGAYPADQLGECLYVAAALQVHLTRLAARVDAARLSPAADCLCPCCGSGPVASLVVGWANADRSRYCCCSLCSTMWNYVRIKCTACRSTAGISYYLIEEQSRDVAIETCSMCKTYIKHIHQHRKPETDPFADDLASYGLDLLAREEGFRRAVANPFMIIGN